MDGRPRYILSNKFTPPAPIARSFLNIRLATFLFSIP